MKAQEIKAGDPCPQCGGNFRIDPAQRPETLVDRRERNTANPAVVARYKRQVEDKAEEHGLIHKCDVCGYQSRFKPADATTGANARFATKQDQSTAS